MCWSGTMAVDVAPLKSYYHGFIEPLSTTPFEHKTAGLSSWVVMAKLFIDRVVERGADRSVALAEIGQSNYSCRLSGD